MVASTASFAYATPASDGLALQKFEDGRVLYEKGQFEQALVAFQASLKLLPSPNSRLYIGRCYRAIGRMGSAYTSLKLAAREAEDRLNATGEKRYRATQEAAIGEMAEIESKVPHLVIAVPAELPEGFKVLLDDEDIGRTSWGAAIEVDAGKHDIKAEGPRRVPFYKSFTIADGEKLRVDVVSPHAPTGSLKLVFTIKPSGVAVQVDGLSVDPNELERARDVTAGSHTILVRAPGYQSFTWKGDVADEEESSVDVKLEVDRSAVSTGTPKWIPISLAGLSLATLGVGTIIAIRARSLSNDEQALHPLRRDPDKPDQIKSLSTDANILFVAGGVLAVGAGILALTTRWSSGDDGGTKKDASIRVIPLAGSNFLGLGGCGAF